MWDEFTKLTDFVPPPTSNSPPTPQNSAATKRKTNVMDDEGFILPAKFSKNLNSKTKITPIINSNNKFETLSNMPDDCADMNNEPIKLQEPNPQPIFMKMSENLTEIISNIENSLNSTLKKKVNGDSVQIYATDITQYRFIQKYLSNNNIEFYAV